MDRTRPGADRIGKRELQAEALAAERQLPGHVKGCLACQQAGSNVRARCATWWRLKRTAHRARRKLRQWQQPETAGMQPLFTDEACDPPPF